MMEHTGVGVARRAAENERRREQRDADDVAAEQPDTVLRVCVPAHEVAAGISLDAAHYALKHTIEPKRKRRAQVRAAGGALEVLKAARASVESEAGGGHDALGRRLSSVASSGFSFAAPSGMVAGSRGAGPARVATQRGEDGGAPAMDEEDVEEEVELPELSFEELLAPYTDRQMEDDAPTGLATELSSSLRTLRKMLRKHLDKMAARGEQVRMVRGSGGALYPEWQFAAGFATKLLTWREQPRKPFKGFLNNLLKAFLNTLKGL